MSTWNGYPLQARYDLEVAERESRKRIEREVTPLKEAAWIGYRNADAEWIWLPE